VDHIKPHEGDERLLWDSDNWQCLCHWHHTQKTWRERLGMVITWPQNNRHWVVTACPGTTTDGLTERYPQFSIDIVAGSVYRGHAHAKRAEATWCVLEVPEDERHKNAFDVFMDAMAGS
jgi:hypothetical protein